MKLYFYILKKYEGFLSFKPAHRCLDKTEINLALSQTLFDSTPYIHLCPIHVHRPGLLATTMETYDTIYWTNSTQYPDSIGH